MYIDSMWKFCRIYHFLYSRRNILRAYPLSVNYTDKLTLLEKMECDSEIINDDITSILEFMLKIM